MCQLLETIKCNNGELFNLKWHNSRFNLARLNYFGVSDKIDLEDLITVSDEFKKGLYRCRVLFSKAIEKVEFIQHEIRKIKRIKLIESDSISYEFKFSDRQNLNELFEKRGSCDDILIIKNGCITDSYTANPIFFDGQNWWTPDTPLLAGTQRAKLLEEQKIMECRITPEDLYKYKKIGLINALQDMQEMPVVAIKNICS